MPSTALTEPPINDRPLPLRGWQCCYCGIGHQDGMPVERGAALLIAESDRVSHGICPECMRGLEAEIRSVHSAPNRVVA